MKRTPEYIEGTEAWTRFNDAMKAVISVPHSVVKEKIEAHRKETALNPNRRGPKTKQKRASRVPHAS